MKKKTFSLKGITKYFSILKGVKLPWILIILGLGFEILMNTMQLEVATLTSSIIDASQYAINAKELLNYVTATASTAVLTILYVYFTRKMEEVINLRIRTKLWLKIMRLPTKYYDEDNGNELVSRVTSDATAPSTLFTTIISCIVCVVTCVQAFIKLFNYNETLAKYSLIIIPLTVLVSAVFAFLQFKLGVYSTVTLAGSLGYLAERVRSFRLIKSAVAEKIESKIGNKTFKRMYLSEFLSWLVVAGYQLSSGMFSVMFIVIVFVLGGQLIPKGEVTIGDLTGFYMITGIVSVQLMQLFMNIGSLAGTFGSMKKIAEISDAQSESTTGETMPELCSDIVFDNVSFSYNDERKVLSNVSVKIPMGKVTAIIGGNGAGKSTMFKLITRLYEPDSGEIRFSNRNISDYSLTSWRDKFAYVFQNDPLIGGTVRENIAYGLKRQISDEELIETAKKANCYDFVMEKPKGFDEDVGLSGSDFSGGQGQCISIARAMLKDADYLLLDEATSNLDVMSEALVTEALDNLMKNRTTVMIAHNYAATKNADYIIVMKDGTVEAAGTPKELLLTNEYYQMFSKLS